MSSPELGLKGEEKHRMIYEALTPGPELAFYQPITEHTRHSGANLEARASRWWFKRWLINQGLERTTGPETGYWT